MRKLSPLFLVAVLPLIACDSDSPAEPDPTYTVGGTVTGLEGSGLVLSNNSTDEVATGNGPFTFATEYDDASVYSVAVNTQPVDPAQTCTVTNGTGVIDGSDVTDVAVVCETPLDNDDLDPGFDEDGRATHDLVDGAHDMVLLDDGRFVIINEFDVARYNADGTPDATFNGGSRVRIDFPGTADRLRSVAVQPDGRIVVVGLTWVQSRAQAGIARLNEDGSIDVAFGQGGSTATNGGRFGAEAFDVAIQPDGYIIVGGTSTDTAADGDLTLFRFTAGGAPDVAFNGGLAHVDMGGRAEIGYAVALQPDGRILIAGRAGETGGSDPNVAIARFNHDGTLDTSFGTQGVSGTVTTWWDEAADIAVQADGRIIVVGHLIPTGQPAEFLVMRLESDGTLDGSFGNAGFAQTADFSDAGDWARAVALYSDGRILVVGQKSNFDEPDFALARYHADGTLDSDFGDAGLNAVDFFADVDIARAVAITPGAAILVAGMAKEGNTTVLALARLLP